MKRRSMSKVTVFDIQNLPLVPLSRVLHFLSVDDIMNLRCLSRWFEKRITFLRKSMFNKFFIKPIKKSNCEEIRGILSLAMAKPHAPEKLEVQVYDSESTTVQQILWDFQKSITSLEIFLFGGDEFLRSIHFESLVSLTLYSIYGSYIRNAPIFDAMIGNHANKLKNLKIESLDEDLGVSSLPVLDSLVVHQTSIEPIWTLLTLCRPTITSLDLFGNDVRDETGLAFFKIPKLRNLSLYCTNAIQFVSVNSEHLLSLQLRELFSLPIDIEWPLFPILRELHIDKNPYLPKNPLLSILMNSRATIERLIIENYYSVDDTFDFKIPRLTDLYVLGGRPEVCAKFLTSNQDSIEFLYLENIGVPNPVDNIKLDRMKSVVMKSIPYRVQYSEQDKERMISLCPNADVVLLQYKEKNLEVRYQVGSRSKRKKFLMDTAELIFKC